MLAWIQQDLGDDPSLILRRDWCMPARSEWKPQNAGLELTGPAKSPFRKQCGSQMRGWHAGPMTTLNKLGAEVAAEFADDVHGATDITGFGLVGHLREMALAGNVSVRIDSAKLTSARRCDRMYARWIRAQGIEIESRVRRMR